MTLIATNTNTGVVVADRVSVAATHASRAVGLLGRSGLDRGEALWIVPSRGVHTWGMRFAIDVVALDERGIVVDHVSRLKPWRIRLPRKGTSGVLELPAGTLAASGTIVGHQFTFTQSDSHQTSDDGRQASDAVRRSEDK
ncbi:MAG TPA: DUF192 domain-containing protein [Vicinamibacterales bacterium]|jgi:uncharacterized membrane protein (UPF0127 family)|nr:DUF192 domain-containing protein [Vicinamibacterales bacterium]